MPVTRKRYGADFKAKVALAAMKGDKTLAELAQQFDVHSNRITVWKAQLAEGAAGIFGQERSEAAPVVDLKALRGRRARPADTPLNELRSKGLAHARDKRSEYREGIRNESGYSCRRPRKSTL